MYRLFAPKTLMEGVWSRGAVALVFVALLVWALIAQNLYAFVAFLLSTMGSGSWWWESVAKVTYQAKLWCSCGRERLEPFTIK